MSLFVVVYLFCVSSLLFCVVFHLVCSFCVFCCCFVLLLLLQLFFQLYNVVSFLFVDLCIYILCSLQGCLYFVSLNFMFIYQL